MRHTLGGAEAATIQIDYQPDVDLLFAWIGSPEPARNVEVDPGVYVRVTPAGNRVVGIEILDCATRFHVNPTDLTLEFVQKKLHEYADRALEKAQS